MTAIERRIEHVERPGGAGLEVRLYNPAARHTIVLTGGPGSDELLWRHLIDDLATDHRVVTWGGVGEGARTGTAEGYAADLDALQRAVGAVTAAHVGFGDGALISLALHDLVPEAVEALVLLQGGLPPAEGKLPAGALLAQRALASLAPAAPLGASLLLRTGGRRGLRRSHTVARRLGLIGRPLGLDDFEALLRGTARGEAGRLRKPAGRRSGQDALASVKVPTLVIGAARDPLYPEELTRQVHESLHNSEYVQLPGAGHTCLLELGPVIAARVRRFLEERRRQRPWKEG